MDMRRALLLTVSAFAIGGAGAALAADDSTVVDPITVTATRQEQPVSTAPATVSVISDLQIEDQLATDIKDLVRFEPGVSVRASPARFSAALGSTGRDGNSGFNIRGLEGNRVLLQVDGIRLPDAFGFGAQAVGRGDYIDLEVVKSVEILRGPASPLYGSDGLAGAVSFITRDPGDFLRPEQGFTLRGRGAYSSADDSWSEGLVAAGRQGRWEAMAAYTHRDGHELDNKGEVDSANVDRTTPNPQDTESNSVLAKLVFRASDDNRFRLTYDRQDSRVETHVLSAIAKPPLGASSTLDLSARDTTQRDRISLDHRYDRPVGFVDRASWAAYFQASTTEQFIAEDRNVSADRERRNTFDNRIFGLNAELQSHAATGDVAHRFVYGGDISVTRQQGVRDGTVAPVGETFPTRAFPTTDYVLAGLFAQDAIALFDERLTLYPGVRLDYYSLDPRPDPLFPWSSASQSGAHVSPKVGAVLKVTEVVSLFGNYAAGFKAPSPSQVNNGFSNVVINYTSLPNPDLKPETSQSFEGGVRLNGPGWSASASAFTASYDDFIEQIQVSGAFTPTDPAVFQYVNLGKVDVAGVEARAQAVLPSGLGFLAAASYARGDAESSGLKAPLDSIDPFKLVAGLTYRDPGGRYGGQFTITHAARKSAGRVDGAACAPSCFRPPAFTVLDATAYWNVNDHATLRAGVFNLTDEKYWWWSDVRGLSASAPTRDAYTQPGRNFSLSLILRM
jgi:hemoglobin/transferrin/lactoferrin receptor protein